jgi:hypothetical protein
VDSRLKSWFDDDGQLWVLCEHCTKKTREEDLAIDPTDGLRWNVCAPCKQKETEQLNIHEEEEST